MWDPGFELPKPTKPKGSNLTPKKKKRNKPKRK